MKKIFVTIIVLFMVLTLAQTSKAEDYFGLGVQTYLITPQLSVKVPLTDMFTVQVSAFPWKMDGEDHSSFATRVILPMSNWDSGNFRAYSAWGMVWSMRDDGSHSDAVLTFGFEQRAGSSQFAQSLEFGVDWADDGDVYPTVNYGFHYYL